MADECLRSLINDMIKECVRIKLTRRKAYLVRNVIVHLLHVEAVAVRVASNPTFATSVAPATGTILHTDGLL